MSVAAVRLAMMERFSSITGINVPSDPLPHTIEDKTLLVFPRLGESILLSKGGAAGKIVIQSEDVMQVEYHRRIPYEHLGSTMGDISTMIDAITGLVWSELAGGKFDGTIFSISRVALTHLGELGWNEWTFGCRHEIRYVHLTHISS